MAAGRFVLTIPQVRFRIDEGDISYIFFRYSRYRRLFTQILR